MTIQLQVGWAGIKVKIKELKKHFYYLKCFRQWVGEPEWLLRTHTENRQKMLQIKRLTKTFFQKKYRIVTHQMWSILQETCAPLFLSFHFAGYNTNSTPTNKQKEKYQRTRHWVCLKVVVWPWEKCFPYVLHITRSSTTIPWEVANSSRWGWTFEL